MRNCLPLAVLSFLLACTEYFEVTNTEPEPTVETGPLVLSIATQGGDLDLNGYRIAIDGKDLGVTVAGSSTLVRALIPGPHVVELLDVAGNCDVADGVQRSVTVEKQVTARATFRVVCYATGIEFTTHTEGVDLDPDGYTVQIADQPAQLLPVSGSLTVGRLTPGTYDVAIHGLEENCRLKGEPGLVVEVPDRELIKVQLEFGCFTTTGVLEVVTRITGDDPDFTGYHVTVDANAEQYKTPTHTTAWFDRLVPGTHQVTLGIAPNCTVEGGTSRTALVTVTSDFAWDTTRVAFDATCIRIPRIAYSRNDTIFVAYSDGTGARVLITGGMSPSWSADGRHLAYTRGECRELYDDRWQVYYTECFAHGISLFSVEGSVIREVTTGEHWNPVLSPDGTSIAYRAQPDGTLQVVSLTSGSITTLDFPSLGERDPVWSPDGTRLAFTCSNQSNTPSEDICLSNVDGSNLTRFYDASGEDFGPAWSPDGTRIAFTTDRYGYPSIAAMAADGTGIVRVVEGELGRWAGSDSRLVFRTLDGHLARINVDGSGLVVLPEHSHGAPAWRP